MHPIITDHLPQIHDLCEKYKVKRLSVFGSVCTDRFTDESDVDVLYEFDREAFPLLDSLDYFLGLAESLQEMFGRKIDMVCEGALSNPYFIEELDETKKVLYDRTTYQKTSV